MGEALWGELAMLDVGAVCASLLHSPTGIVFGNHEMQQPARTRETHATKMRRSTKPRLRTPVDQSHRPFPTFATAMPGSRIR